MPCERLNAQGLPIMHGTRGPIGKCFGHGGAERRRPRQSRGPTDHARRGVRHAARRRTRAGPAPAEGRGPAGRAACPGHAKRAVAPAPIRGTLLVPLAAQDARATLPCRRSRRSMTAQYRHGARKSVMSCTAMPPTEGWPSAASRPSRGPCVRNTGSRPMTVVAVRHQAGPDAAAARPRPPARAPRRRWPCAAAARRAEACSRKLSITTRRRRPRPSSAMMPTHTATLRLTPQIQQHQEPAGERDHDAEEHDARQPPPPKPEVEHQHISASTSGNEDRSRAVARTCASNCPPQR